MSKFPFYLEIPSYGFVRDGVFYRPSHREIFGEFFRRLNIFESKKNWLPFVGWVTSLSLFIPLYFFLTGYFSWPILIGGFIYSMVGLGTYGTVWLHRYSTHRAYQFRSKFAAFIVRNIVIKVVPEEVYVVSHHVHHQLSEKPGDPYNVNGGWLYCFLADVTHQTISKNLSKNKYEVLTRMIRHTGVRINSYEQYLKWGSICHPIPTILHFVLNWAFWYGVFFLLGGHSLALGLFGMSAIWAMGIRTFNYSGHGSGKDKRQEGIDFNRKDLSINQIWPGYVAGEWHNNHHLYPSSARSGFLPYQLDLAWIFIWICWRIGAVKTLRNDHAHFMKIHYLPYLTRKRAVSEGQSSTA